MQKKIENISVLMPAYNCSKYIESSIRSILKQSFKNFELLIINDGSTDNTENIIKKIQDNRIRYYFTEHQGTSAALNYGAVLCRYEWIARIDSDDLNTVNRLERQIKYIEENPEVDILSSWSVYFKDPAKVLFLLREPIYHNKINKYLDLHNPINQSSLLIRKSILAESKYDESFDAYEDFELMYRLREKYRIAIIPEFLVYTRLRKDSRTNTGSSDRLFEMLSTSAFKKMIESKSKGDHFYWAQVTAWLNYFYGSRKLARGYLKNSKSLKNFTAYCTTFLPDKYFIKFINSHLKYRIKAIIENKSRYKKELLGLLKN